MQDLPEFSRADDAGRLVKRGVDGGKRRQIYDRSPADALPDFADDINRAEQRRVQQHGLPLETEQAQQVVNHAAAGGEIHNHAADDHHRDKVRKIADRLHRALKPVLAHFVEQNGQDNRSGEPENKIAQAQRERIGQKAGKINALEKRPKMLEPDPRTSGDFQLRHEILKRDRRAVHRHIAEQNVIDDHRDRHEVYVAVLPPLFLQGPRESAFPAAAGFLSGKHRAFPSLDKEGGVSSTLAAFSSFVQRAR